jgi:predicted phage tail protein
MQRDIYLHGHLEKFGRHYRLDVASPAEAIRALAAQLHGFRGAVSDGAYRIILGDLDKARDLDVSNLTLQGSGPIHLVPVVAGGGGRTGKIIIGVAIMAAAAYGAYGAVGPWMEGQSALGASAFTVAGASVSWGSIAVFGGLLAVSGVAQMLAPQPKMPGSLERPEDRPSFMFNGATNVTEQGNAMPLVYGRHRSGSVVISSGLSAEQI